MLPRAIAGLLSLMLHGVVGYAIWPRLESENLEVLDLGKGQDIVLTPMGTVMNASSDAGENFESIDPQEALSADARRPTQQPPAIAPPERLPDTVVDAETKETRKVVAVREQKPTARPSAIGPTDQLGDTANIVESEKTQEAVVAEEQRPVSQHPTVASSEQLPNVIASEANTVEQEISKATELPSDVPRDQKVAKSDARLADEVKEAKTVTADQPPAPDELKRPKAITTDEPPPTALNEPKIANSSEPAAPDELKEPKGVPPDEREAHRIDQPKGAETNGPLALESLEALKPEVKEVLAQPQQAVIVTEPSSGEAKKDGGARVVAIYVGEINERVQRSKVNPHSRETGVVVLKFTVGTDGSLLSMAVASTSGSTVLDGAAMAAINRASPFPPIPPDVGMNPITFMQPFKFVVR